MHHFKHVLHPDASIMICSGVFCLFGTSSHDVARVKHRQLEDKHNFVKVDGNKHRLQPILHTLCIQT